MAKASNEISRGAAIRTQRPISTSMSKRCQDELNSDIALVHTFGQVQLSRKTTAQPYDSNVSSNGQQAFKFLHAERQSHYKNRSSTASQNPKNVPRHKVQSRGRSLNNKSVTAYSRQHSTVTHQDSSKDSFNKNAGVLVQKGRQVFQRQLKTFKFERERSISNEPESALIKYTESPTCLCRQDSKYLNEKQTVFKPLVYPKTTIILNVSQKQPNAQRPQTGNVLRSQKVMATEPVGNNRYREKHSRQQASSFLRNSRSSEDLVAQASCQVNLDDAYGMNEGGSFYQHRFGDGSIARDSKFFSNASPSARVGQMSSVNQFETKRLETPFGCVLTQRAGAVMKPKSVFQRRKDNKNRVLQFETKKKAYGGDKMAQKVTLRASFVSRASGLQKVDASMTNAAIRNPPSVTISFQNIQNLPQHHQVAPTKDRDNIQQVINRSLLSHRPPLVSLEMFKDQSKSISISPGKRQNPIYDSKSYASLHSSENYLQKHSISLVALRSLHGAAFCDSPPKGPPDVSESNQPISPMSPKMVEQQIQTMSEMSLGAATSPRAFETAADLFFAGGKNGSVVTGKQSHKEASNRLSKTKMSQASRAKFDSAAVNVTVPTASIEPSDFYPATKRQQDMFKMVIRASNQGKISKEDSSSGNLNYVTVKRPESSSSHQRKAPQKNTLLSKNLFLQVKGDQKAIVKGRYVDSIPTTVKSNTNLFEVKVKAQSKMHTTDIGLTQVVESLPDDVTWELKKTQEFQTTTLDMQSRRRGSHSPAATFPRRGAKSSTSRGRSLPRRSSQARNSTVSIHQQERAESRNINAFPEEDEAMTLVLHEPTKDVVGQVRLKGSVHSVIPPKPKKDGNILVIQNGQEVITETESDRSPQNKRTSNAPAAAPSVSFEKLQIAPLPAATAYNFIKRREEKSAATTQKNQQRKAVQLTTHVFGQEMDSSSVENSRPQSQSHSQLRSMYTHKRHRRGQSGNRQKRKGSQFVSQSIANFENQEHEVGKSRLTLLTLPKTQDSIPHSQMASTANISMKDLCGNNESKDEMSIDPQLLKTSLDEEEKSVLLEEYQDDLDMKEGVSQAEQKQSNEKQICIPDPTPVEPMVETADGLKSITDLNIVSQQGPQSTLALIVADNSTLALLDQSAIQDLRQQQRQQQMEAPRRNPQKNKQLRQKSHTIVAGQLHKRPRQATTDENQDKIKMFQSILRLNQFPSAYKKKHI